jgi:uncharacterized membrane protein
VPAAVVTWYEVWKTIHILMAVIWVGGAFTVQVLALLAMRSPLPGRKAEFAKEAEKVGMRVFAPASLILVVMGFILVQKGHWDYHTWVILALIAFALSFLTGIAFLGPESGRIAKAIAAEGPDSPAVVARINRILLVSRIELAILILIVIDMVIKPGQ